MNFIKKRGYELFSIMLYLILYYMISLKIPSLFSAFFGIMIILIIYILDIYMSSQKIRVIARFIFTIIAYFILLIALQIMIFILSPGQSYTTFDTMIYFFLRDSLPAMILITIYFLTDSPRLKKVSIFNVILSFTIILFIFNYIFNYSGKISDSIFTNYFNYAVSLILITVLIILKFYFYINHNSSIIFRKKNIIILLLLLIPLIFFLIFITLNKHIEENDKLDSGLFSSGLFQFDFSNFLELKDEINLSDDRVLIMELSGIDKYLQKQKRDEWNRQIYLKRFSLEQYVKPGGFKMTEKYHEKDSPPIYLGGYKWEKANLPKLIGHSTLIQTLYLVNIDPTSLMGSEVLTKVIPVELWEDAPFKQIYKSHSYTFTESYQKLLDDMPSQENFINSLSENRKRLLLEWGEKENEYIKELAENITQGFESPLLKAFIIDHHLRNNYYYSLKPGLSIDSNQLKYFLTESHKAYCTYFAFAMTLMLRSLDIPSRVAVGFAPDMRNHTLNFYDVRVNDGHAWVEVFFDDYGWITFDPTSSEIAEGEEYEFEMGNKEERDDLIDDILQNKDNMKEIHKEKKLEDALDNVLITLQRSVRTIGVIFLILFILLLSGSFLLYKYRYLIRYKIIKDRRKKIIYLYKHILLMLKTNGESLNEDESLEEFSDRMSKKGFFYLPKFTSFFQEAYFHSNLSKSITIKKLDNMLLIFKKQVKRKYNKNILKSVLTIPQVFKKIIPLIVISLLSYPILNADESITDNKKSIYVYIAEARNAINSDYFDKALSILKEAEETYPESYMPNYERGKLYFEQDLYNNALDDLLLAKSKGLNNETGYTYIANSYGKLGRDDEALETYLEAYEMLTPSLDIYDNIGWMCYKTHKIDDGISYIMEGLEKFPDSADLYMTLGTLYSASWDYKNSKLYYLKCIEESYGNKSNNFRAIAYYNLSLVEESFLNYDKALESARASISMKNRSSAHMELCYLYSKAFKLKEAYKEIKEAQNLEPRTFFPEIALIDIFIMSGNLDKAINLAKQLKSAKDYGWMLYFGTSIDSFHSDIFNSLAIAYKYKSNQIYHSDKKTIDIFPLNKIIAFSKSLYYRAMSLYYQVRFTNLSISLSNKKIDGGSELEGLQDMARGFEDILPGTSRKFLNLSSDIELELNPKKKRIYTVEKLIVSKPLLFKRKYTKQLSNAINNLDSVWEQYLIAEGLELLLKYDKPNRYTHEETAFIKYPSLLPVNKINLKVKYISKNLKGKNFYKIITKLKPLGLKFDKNSKIHCEISLINDDNIRLQFRNNEQIINQITINFADSEWKEKTFNKLFKIPLQ